MERTQLEAVVEQTGYAEKHCGCSFLCHPQWSDIERGQVEKLWSAAGSTDKMGAHELGWMCIATGGTSGGVRFARHDEHTVSAAVAGFCTFFGLEKVNAVDVLPGYHVSGLMARIRCAATGGRHVPCDWRRLEAGERPSLDVHEGRWVISLVPTQLQRLLASPGATEWLRGFHVIFVGGGPTWPDLTRTAAESGLAISLTYGMTETAAMVAAVPVQEFLAGERLFATPLPHARIALDSDGVVAIEGESVFRGYFPETLPSRRYETDDLGQLDERGRLQLFGRKDAVIITGGKKVQPVEVEAALQATAQFVDVTVIGVPDVEWGESVIACYPKGATSEPNWTIVDHGLQSSLAAYKRPKRYVAMTDWPRNAQGKLNRVELRRRVATSEAS